MTDPIPKSRWYRLTPDRLIVGLLAAEGFLLLSECFQWFAFNTAHIVLLLLLCSVFIASLIFRPPFQFGIRSLLVLIVAVAVPCSWLGVRMKEARKQREVVEAIEKLGGKSPLKELAVDLGGGVKMELVLIPAGEFLMGSPDSDTNAVPNEKPQHKVRIAKPFYLGKYVVTQEQWEAVMGSNLSNFKGPKNPVEMVSWEDCQKFLKRLNDKVRGGKFQLPTEAQWEYACRAGSKTRYCFGDDEEQLGEYAWYSGDKTHPVGEKKPNAWGLFDMHGNVSECCQDWYDDAGYYAKSPTDDPMGAATGSFRVFRGGSWLFPAWFCRSAYRSGSFPGFRYGFLGFRASLVPADK